MTDPLKPTEKIADENGAWVPSEAVRGYFYRVLTAAIPLLTFWGVVAETEVPLYIGLGAAVLGFPLAAANTSVKKEN